MDCCVDIELRGVVVEDFLFGGMLVEEGLGPPNLKLLDVLLKGAEVIEDPDGEDCYEVGECALDNFVEDLEADGAFLSVFFDEKFCG